MRKSSPLTQNYRPGSSRKHLTLASFREQMADFARGERLLELRKTTHLSRERAAMEIGVSAKTLFEWEHGGKIRWENAQKAALFYSVDPESLVTRDIAVLPEAEPSQLDRIEANQEEMLAILRGLGGGGFPGPPGELGRRSKGPQPKKPSSPQARKKRAADDPPSNAG